MLRKAGALHGFEDDGHLTDTSMNSDDFESMAPTSSNKPRPASSKSTLDPSAPSSSTHHASSKHLGSSLSSSLDSLTSHLSSASQLLSLQHSNQQLQLLLANSTKSRDRLLSELNERKNQLEKNEVELEEVWRRLGQGLAMIQMTVGDEKVLRETREEVEKKIPKWTTEQEQLHMQMQQMNGFHEEKENLQHDINSPTTTKNTDEELDALIQRDRMALNHIILLVQALEDRSKVIQFAIPAMKPPTSIRPPSPVSSSPSTSISDLSQSLSLSQQRISELEQLLHESSITIDQLKSKEKLVREQLLESVEVGENLERELKKEKIKREKERIDLEDQLRLMKQKSQSEQQQYEHHLSSLQSLESSYSSLKSTNLNLIEENNKLQSEVTSLSSKFSTTSIIHQSEIQKKLESINKYENDIELHQLKLDKYENSNKILTNEINKLQKRIIELEEERENDKELNKKMKLNLEKEIKEEKKKVEEEKKKIEEEKRKGNEIENELKQEKQRVMDLMNEVKEEKSKCNIGGRRSERNGMEKGTRT